MIFETGINERLTTISKDELMRIISRNGLALAAKILKTDIDTIINKIKEFGIDTVLVPNVRLRELDVIEYVYSDYGLIFIAKNIGTDYFSIETHLKAENIEFISVPEKYLAVSADAVKQIIDKHSLEKASKKTGVFMHKLVKLTGIKVRDN